MNRSMLLRSVIGAGVAAVVAYKTMRRHRRHADQMHEDEAVTQALDDSFPASDPPSYTPTTGPALSPER